MKKSCFLFVLLALTFIFGVSSPVMSKDAGSIIDNGACQVTVNRASDYYYGEPVIVADYNGLSLVDDKAVMFQNGSSVTFSVRLQNSDSNVKYLWFLNHEQVSESALCSLNFDGSRPMDLLNSVEVWVCYDDSYIQSSEFIFFVENK